MEKHFNTTKELIENKILDIGPQGLMNKVEIGDSQVLKNKYNRLSQYIEKNRKLTKLMLKIGQQKAILGKERSKIKRHKGQKIHKFFMERKK